MLDTLHLPSCFNSQKSHTIGGLQKPVPCPSHPTPGTAQSLLLSMLHRFWAWTCLSPGRDPTQGGKITVCTLSATQQRVLCWESTADGVSISSQRSAWWKTEPSETRFCSPSSSSVISLVHRKQWRPIKNTVRTGILNKVCNWKDYRPSNTSFKIYCHVFVDFPAYQHFFFFLLKKNTTATFIQGKKKRQIVFLPFILLYCLRFLLDYNVILWFWDGEKKSPCLSNIRLWL